MICENDKNDPVREAECFYLKPIFDWEGGGGGGVSKAYIVKKKNGRRQFHEIDLSHFAVAWHPSKIHLTLNFYLKLGLVCAKKYY